MAKVLKVGSTVVSILNGVSPVAAVACIFFLGGAWHEFGLLKDTVESHCAKQEDTAEKLEVARIASWEKQATVDRQQDAVWEMFGSNLARLEGKVDSAGTDLTIIKGILMAVPDPRPRGPGP